MKKGIFIAAIFISFFGIMNPTNAQDAPSYTLLLIDIQDFYFPGGGYELVNPEEASINAADILKSFRDKELPVIHIKHNAKNNADIHKNVSPVTGEKIIVKDHANGFVDTKLQAYLKELQSDTLVICGMQTHMCVEATTRAAKDFGYHCIVVENACATRDLKYEDEVIPARQVHASTLASLNRTYSRIVTSGEIIIMLEKE